MKRITAMILAGSLLALTACGGNRAAAQPENSRPVQQIHTTPEKSPGFSREDKPTAKAEGLEGILKEIESDYEETIASFQERLEQVNMLIGNDYEAYKKNSGLIDDWYEFVISESEQLFQRTEEQVKHYFILMTDQVDHNADEMEDAAEEIYDRIYDDARDDYYDVVYDDLMDDIYDDYYDDLLDDIYKQVPYDEYYDQRMRFYEAWADAHGEIYELWMNHGMSVYEMWIDVTSAIYQRNYDFAFVLDKEKPVSNVVERPLLPSEGTTENTEDPERKPTVSEGTIRPEFKEMMDNLEGFFDEYVVFLQKMSSNPSDLSAMADYIRFMTLYAENMETLESMDTDELTTEEMAYYIEATARIEQKLLTVGE